MLDRLMAAYREGGLRRMGQKLQYQYCHLVETHLRPRTPMHERLLKLNGVEVPVPISPLDEYLPFFEPALPLRSNPAYEQTEVEAVRSYCRKGDHVVVIGGGLGVTAATAAHTVGLTGRVTVYEPLPTAVGIIRRTLEQNGCADRVEVIRAAVGTPRASCFSYKQGSNPPMIPYADLPAADVYEMDCEGEELPILRRLPTPPRVVLVETHDNFADVRRVLQERGYRLDGVVGEAPESGPDRRHIRAVRAAGEESSAPVQDVD